MIRGKKAWVTGVIGAAFLLVLAFTAFAAEDDIVNGVPYLREGAGARSLAMGGASTAVASDATATVWNVAGLSKVKCTSVASMYTVRDQLDRRHHFLAFAQSLKEFGTFGMAWINAGVSDIARYDANDTAGGPFSSSDNAFLLSYGAFFKPVSLGGGIKILTEKIDPEAEKTSMGFGGLDIGIMADPVQAITIGMVVKNIFGTIADSSIPIQLKLGTALRLLPEDNLLLAVDLEKSFVDLAENTEVVHMGAEYWAAKLVSFRLGITSKKEFSAGIGINISNVIMDYAYTIKRNGLEPDSHYISITASF